MSNKLLSRLIAAATDGDLYDEAATEICLLENFVAVNKAKALRLEKELADLGERLAVKERMLMVLHDALNDIVSARMIWNGGIAPYRREELQSFIEELKEIAAYALRTYTEPQEPNFR